MFCFLVWKNLFFLSFFEFCLFRYDFAWHFLIFSKQGMFLACFLAVTSIISCIFLKYFGWYPCFHPQSFPYLQTYCLGFYWNSLVQKEVWAMTSSEWELCVAANLLTNLKHLKRVSIFLLMLDKKAAYYKISKERIIVIASVVGLDNLISNLQIIILFLITKLIFKYKSPW